MPLLAPVQAPAAPPPPPPDVHDRPGFTQTWTDWTGKVWPLTGRYSGVRLGKGIRGLHFPKATPQTSSSPALPGYLWLGNQIEARECFWSVRVFADGTSQDWIDYDSAWAQAMRPDKTGTWTVISPGSGEDRTTRKLVCRPRQDGDFTFDVDPAQIGWVSYPQYLMAESSFWAGELQLRTFRNSPPVQFFPGPPFNISSASTQANATIDNTGDVDARPLFVLDGPLDAGASVGVGDVTTVYGAAIPDGKTVVVDTRPELIGVVQIDTPTDAQGARLDPGTDDWWDAINSDGEDVITSVADDALALDVKVAPGESQPVAINSNGQGVVHVALQPLHYRAWG